MSAGPAWVFHRGALGDSVLLWPRLRAMTRHGREVTLVADRSKGLLAADETGTTALDAEQARFNAMWRDEASPEPVEGVAEVIWFGEAALDSADLVWERNARAMFPGAMLSRMGRPDSTLAREWTERGGRVGARSNPRGHVLCHVGAGSETKRWPLDRFGSLTRGLVDRFIAGEVEAERFTARERDMFRGLGGTILRDLDELAATLRGARLVIACDSGPGHLAAQIGVPTLSLFGPTDPERWAPVGPRVRVVAPPEPSPMSWLTPERVIAEALALRQIS